jgi:multiple sugar transport system permease protein
MGFFKAIPGDLEEAAMIDGCSRFGAFLRVVIPISVAGVLTVVIFAFTLVTQEFVYAMTFISGVRQFTVSVGVPTFLVRGDVYFLGSLMAGCFIASVPIAILSISSSTASSPASPSARQVVPQGLPLTRARPESRSGSAPYGRR